MSRRRRARAAANVVVRVAIYVRMSKDDTDEMLGVEQQEEEVREMLDDEYGEGGYEVVRVYCDNNISAYSEARRPDYEAMLAEAAAGGFDVMAAWDGDRVYRRVKTIDRLLDVIGDDPDRGIEVLTVEGGFYDLSTAKGRHDARADANRAQYESEHKGERIRSRKAQYRRKGWPTPRPGYGYVHRSRGRHRGGTYAQVEEQANGVRVMAGEYLAGGSWTTAARAANEGGYRTPTGSPWTGPDVRKVLMRPALAGLMLNDEGALVPGDWEPILDRSQWDAIQAATSDPQRKHKTKRVKPDQPGAYWARPMLVDPWGVGLTGGRKADVQGGHTRRAYSSPWDPKRKGTVSIDADAVEGFLTAAVEGGLHLLSWDERSTELAPTPEGNAVTELERKLGELSAAKTRSDLLADDDPTKMLEAEYSAQRMVLWEALQKAKAAGPRPTRRAPRVPSGNVVKRWGLPEGRGGYSTVERQRLVLWAVGERNVRVLPGRGGRHATSPAELAKRLVFLGGPLHEAQSAGAGSSRPPLGRPSGRRGPGSQPRR